jgi:hypothetical protein
MKPLKSEFHLNQKPRSYSNKTRPIEIKIKRKQQMKVKWNIRVKVGETCFNHLII